MTLSQITVSEIDRFGNVPTNTCHMFVDQLLIHVVNEMFVIFL